MSEMKGQCDRCGAPLEAEQGFCEECEEVERELSEFKSKTMPGKEPNTDDTVDFLVKSAMEKDMAVDPKSGIITDKDGDKYRMLSPEDLMGDPDIPPEIKNQIRDALKDIEKTAKGVGGKTAIRVGVPVFPDNVPHTNDQYVDAVDEYLTKSGAKLEDLGMRIDKNQGCYISNLPGFYLPHLNDSEHEEVSKTIEGIMNQMNDDAKGFGGFRGSTYALIGRLYQKKLMNGDLDEKWPTLTKFPGVKEYISTVLEIFISTTSANGKKVRRMASRIFHLNSDVDEDNDGSGNNLPDPEVLRKYQQVTVDKKREIAAMMGFVSLLAAVHATVSKVACMDKGDDTDMETGDGLDMIKVSRLLMNALKDDTESEGTKMMAEVALSEFDTILNYVSGDKGNGKKGNGKKKGPTVEFGKG